jgi:Ni,Fe-hydrogenase I large subunit
MTLTAKTLRSFASGLLVASSILGSVYFFGGNNQATTAEKLSADEMKTKLASKGYVVYTQEEWNEQQDALKAAQKKAKEAADAKGAQPQPAEKIVYHTMLSVSSGMTSIDVGNALVQAKIIPNALEFSQEVEKRGLANELRPGMYEVKSGMTMDEIIAVIFQQ